MTGKIKSLSDRTSSGLIQAENGESVQFESNDVLAYDLNCLAVGQMVSFELDTAPAPRALNVCSHKSEHLPRAGDKRPEIVDVRYAGFAQTGSIRTFRFERISPGKETQMFIVTGDMTLFSKYRVGIQEGPAMCLHVLVAELDASIAAHRPPVACCLREEDLVTYLASRPVPGSRGRSKRATSAPAAVTATAT